jgi:hypothetical protein
MNRDETGEAQDGAGADADPQELPFRGAIPDFIGVMPKRLFATADYQIRLVEDPPLHGGPLVGKYTYTYALPVIHLRTMRTVCIVTLENSPYASNVLCVFENDGGHSNYGGLSGPDLEQEFVSRALELVRKRFALGAIEETLA